MGVVVALKWLKAQPVVREGRRKSAAPLNFTLGITIFALTLCSHAATVAI